MDLRAVEGAYRFQRIQRAQCAGNAYSGISWTIA